MSGDCVQCLLLQTGIFKKGKVAQNAITLVFLEVLVS